MQYKDNTPEENSLNAFPYHKLRKIETQTRVAQRVAGFKIALIAGVAALIVYPVSRSLAVTALVLAACLSAWLFTNWQIWSAADAEHQRTDQGEGL